LSSGEDDWDWLRGEIAKIRTSSRVKEEPSDSELEEALDGDVVQIVNPDQRVSALPEGISSTFKDGRPLHRLIDDLKKNVDDAM